MLLMEVLAYCRWILDLSCKWLCGMSISVSGFGTEGYLGWSNAAASVNNETMISLKDQKNLNVRKSHCKGVDLSSILIRQEVSI